MIILLLGCTLVVSFWIIAWTRITGISEFYFFPLWLGYILLVNGISNFLFNSSLMRSLGSSFWWLFIISIPMWWFFESLNSITKNWEYVLASPISDLRYFVEASIDFSTVIPAVLSTTYVICRALWSWHDRVRSKAVVVRESYLISSALLGLLAFCFVVLFPREAFPLIWIAPILLLEPVAYATGFPSWLRHIERGDYLLLASVALGTLFTGVWWELWNYYSMPKWVYHIPYVGFWHVFEMPLLGYLGYPFFGLFLLSYTCSVMALLFNKDVIAALTTTGEKSSHAAMR